MVLYLLKWILVVPDHDFGSDESQELDEGVHVAQSDVSERTVLGTDLVSDIEMQGLLGKRFKKPIVQLF